MAHHPLASKLPPFTLLDEPLLAFSPEQSDDVDVHPLRGLSRYGPFSKGSFGAFTANVQAAIHDLQRHGIKPAALLVDTIFSSDGVYADPAGFLKPAAEAIRDAVDLPVVAIEPAVKPAVSLTRSGVVGVICQRPWALATTVPTTWPLTSLTTTVPPGSAVPLMGDKVPTRPGSVMSTLVTVSMVKGLPCVSPV